ncbi:MAG: sigma-54-dependent transcriptional regulator [bacterium]|jgi:two-component system response regulator AtoC
MKILLVDDDRASRAAVAEFLSELGHSVTECDNGAEALAAFTTADFPMVLSDIKMPRMSGLELLHALSALPTARDTDVVLFTGYGDMKSAVEALRAGAYDYLLKPISVEELAVITDRIAEHKALRRENQRFPTCLGQKAEAATDDLCRDLSQLRKESVFALGLGQIGIFSPVWRKVVQEAQKYHKDRSIPVLIHGETGTGKEIVAKIIHFGSTKELTPFVDINCAALAPSLFESELFGYEAGSFTGGQTRGQKGKLDLAAGGTLFFDEISEIPLELQGKLLRVFQEKEYYRVGGLRKIKLDARIICASNVDLAKRVAEGKFRRDLYFRLRVGEIFVPPLRERKEAILPLAQMFLHELSHQKGKRFEYIDEDASQVLRDYPWPGNIRELRNTIEWVVFRYNDAALKTSHLGILSCSPTQFKAMVETPSAQEISFIAAPLNETGRSQRAVL